MKRGYASALALTSLAPILATAGCNALTVNSFAGATMLFTLESAQATAAGTHLELWARDGNNDIIRIAPYTRENKGLTQNGFIIKPAVTVDSPCMIADNGYLLTDPRAYPTTTTLAGIPQSPEQQAQSIINRINQLNPPSMTPLLAVLPYSATQDPVFDANTTAATRKSTCQALEANDSNYYVPQPNQVTAPINGIVYGFIGFQTFNPPADYDGFRLDVPVNLKTLQELYFTVESVPVEQVDPANPGPLYVTSSPAPGGRDILQFTLSPAQPGGPAGAVAVENTLNEDPVQF